MAGVFRKTIQYGVFAAICSGVLACTPMANYNPTNLADATAAKLSVVDKAPQSNLQPLPPRPTRGQGAAAGALEGAGAVFGATDPYAILLLPVFVPLGAIIGAAAVPNDEEWAEIEAYWARAKSGSDKMVGWVAKIKAARLVEAGFASAVDAGQAGNVTCAQVASRSKRCNLGQGDVVLKVELLHSVTPIKTTEGGGFSGKKKRTVENFIYSVSSKTLIQEISTGKVGCYVTSYSTTMEYPELSKPNAEKVLADRIRRQGPVIGRLLAYDLFTYLTSDQKERGNMIKARKAQAPEDWSVGFVFHGGTTCEDMLATAQKAG